MNKLLISTALLLAAAAPLFADSFSITVTITSTSFPTVIPTGTYQGSFTTNGTCTLCTVGNGGITSLDVPIHTGPEVTIPAVLVFDAVESGALPQYDTGTHTLSGNINMLQTLIESTNPNFPSGTRVFMALTPATLNSPLTPCVSPDFQGCVTIGLSEGSIAQGTYVITAQPAAGGCPATIGFWKHHPFPDSVQVDKGLKIGNITYSVSDLLTILNKNGGNAVVILGRQLVGALLNLAAGGVHNSGADSAIASAQTLLTDNSLNLLTSSVPPSTQLGQALVAKSTILDNYNNADFNTCREGSGLKTGSK